MYRIVFENRARKALEKLPRQEQSRIAVAIDRLAEDPRPVGVVKLSGPSGLWRLRVGDYRAIYAIEDAELRVLIVKVGNRRDVYDR